MIWEETCANNTVQLRNDPVQRLWSCFVCFMRARFGQTETRRCGVAALRRLCARSLNIHHLQSAACAIILDETQHEIIPVCHFSWEHFLHRPLWSSLFFHRHSCECYLAGSLVASSYHCLWLLTQDCCDSLSLLTALHLCLASTLDKHNGEISKHPMHFLFRQFATYKYLAFSSFSILFEFLFFLMNTVFPSVCITFDAVIT